MMRGTVVEEASLLTVDESSCFDFATRRPNGYASDRCDNAPYHDVAKKPQLASRGRVVAVLVWDAVILLLTNLAQRGSKFSLGPCKTRLWVVWAADW